MVKTWIIDMSHFDYRDEEAHTFPKRVLKHWSYFGDIVQATVERSPLASTGLPCRRRPGRHPCDGIIQSELASDGNALRWWCPECGENGQISNWKGTRWDPSRRPLMASFPRSGELFGPTPSQAAQTDAIQEIEGTVEWDEQNDGQLPRIVTGTKSYTWNELGQELMTYEGFRITIKIEG
jgi:hypothetical protein